MPEYIQGNLDAGEMSVAIIVGRFNQFISQSLLDGALDCLYRHNMPESEASVYWVPGSFEIPLAAQKIARTKNVDAIICLGTVIRGATPHFDFIAASAANGIAKISLEKDIPISFGILTTDTIEQAIERAGTKAGNKGWDAALTVIEMVNLLKQIPQPEFEANWEASGLPETHKR